MESQEEEPQINDFTSNTLKINLEIDKERLEINKLKNIHELILEKNEELSQLKTLNKKYEISRITSYNVCYTKLLRLSHFQQFMQHY